MVIRPGLFLTFPNGISPSTLCATNAALRSDLGVGCKVLFVDMMVSLAHHGHSFGRTRAHLARSTVTAIMTA